MSQEKLSLSFRVCHTFGIIHDTEKYGQISIFGIFVKVFKTIKTAYYFKKPTDQASFKHVILIIIGQGGGGKWDAMWERM